MIKEELDADMEKIDTLVPYTGTYQEISAQGQAQVNSRYKPELKPVNSNIANYGRIVIATPTWWYTMAPSILTLLSNINLEGKEVVLVQTHAGWPGSCLEDMEKLCKGANVISKKDILFDSNGGDELITPLNEINSWISSLEKDNR